MYLGSWKIDDYVPIPVTCHRFSSGAAYAPTSLTYSIYEDGGTTGIAEDVDMTPASPHDGVVGFYLARPQLTAAAGYEKGKNYTILIKATVDSVAAIAVHTFQIEAEVDSNSVSGTVGTVTNLTNLPAVTTDWLTAAGIKADAVTKIQNGLALEATLTAMKGAGWTTETLAALAVLLNAIKAKTDNLPTDPADQSLLMAAIAAISSGASSVTVTGPVATGGDINIVRGDDYYNADGRALEWTSLAWPNLTSATVTFKAAGGTNITLTVVTAGGAGVAQKVRLELSAVQTAELPTNFAFDIEAELDTSDHVVTLVRAHGTCK